MNKELKERAHKEFDETFKGIDVWEVPYNSWKSPEKELKSFIDSLIDKTVQMTEDRIVERIEKLKIIDEPIAIETKQAILVWCIKR